MTANGVILAGACAGLLLNTVALLTIAWRGGHLLGRMEGTQQQITDGLARVVRDLDALELRVGHLEGRA